jgi:GxxExxY protein
MDDNLTAKIIGAAIEVHRELGPGLLESVYEECLSHELINQNIPFERQKPIPITYKGLTLDCGFRIDLLVDHQIIVELKTVNTLEKIHDAQVLTYLKLTGLKVGLLINFNTLLLKHGIKRLINGY